MTALVIDGPKGQASLATSDPTNPATPAPGTLAAPLPADMLEGYIDLNDGKRVFGWAWCRSRPGDPVEIEIRVDDRPVVTVLADRLRRDLVRAGVRDGRHGFDAALSDPLPAEERHRISAYACSAPGKPAKALIDRTLKPQPPKGQNTTSDGAPNARAAAPAAANAGTAALSARPGKIRQVIGTLIGGQRSLQTAVAGLGAQIEQMTTDRRDVDGAAMLTLTKAVDQLQAVQETLARQAAAVEILQTRLDAATAALSEREAPSRRHRDDRSLYWIVGALSLISAASLLVGLYSLLA